MIPPGVPGTDLVRKGLDDLEHGVVSAESLLISIGAPRLHALGVPVRNPHSDPEQRLWQLLAADDVDSAHSRYNALVRRLVSFEQTLACAV